MTRFLAIFLCSLLIAAPQSANPDTKPIALTVELTGEQDVQRMLEGLEKMDARITFFLEDGAATSEQTGQIAAAGHEMGLTIHSREQGGLLSRRNLAAQIMDARSELPPTVKPHWLRLEEGLTDGARQVARAKNLAILGEQDGDAREGCVMDLGSATVDEVLLTVNRLQGQGYRLVTVSELARLNRVKFRPGRVYEDLSGEGLPRPLVRPLKTDAKNTGAEASVFFMEKVI